MHRVMLDAVLTAIGSAQWKMSYRDFLARLDARDDTYWQEKWRDFQKLATYASAFDADTLLKLIGEDAEKVTAAQVGLPPFADE